MIDLEKAIIYINKEAKKLADKNQQAFKRGDDKTLKFGKGRCAAYVKQALIHGGASIKNSYIEAAKDYGTWLIENGFVPIENAKAQIINGCHIIADQKTGDVVIIEAIKKTKHIYGHIALFDGKFWVSDFVQLNGFYPGISYREAKTPFVLYRYTNNQPITHKNKKSENNTIKKINIAYPIPKDEHGNEFLNLTEILSHLNAESTGHYLLGRNGMWHSGIHITNTTTPWCALSSKKIIEHPFFSDNYNGKQPIRCMADGEIIAYRINQDYLTIAWQGENLQLSNSFVLIKHIIQLGNTERSRLIFYSLYMHLTPYIAYPQTDEKTTWELKYSLNAYPPEWKNNVQIKPKAVLPKGTLIKWCITDNSLKVKKQLKNIEREYGLVEYQTDKNETIQYWILVDSHNIQPIQDKKIPSWWQHFSAQNNMEFDSVICPKQPIAITAGESVGHMGFYQAPTENGIQSRYQVHIECFSNDDNLPLFLQNPDSVEYDMPYYLKCLSGLILWEKNKSNEFIKTQRITQLEILYQLDKLNIETDKKQHNYYFLPEHLGYIPKRIKTSQKDKDILTKQLNQQDNLDYQNTAQYTLFLSRYDFLKIGFTTVISEISTFDYLDGYTQPKNTYISNIFETILNKVKSSNQPNKEIITHNYQRLINIIESSKKNYKPEEYRRAFHNPEFSSIVNKKIVKHPSDWYYKKNDPIWQPFLNNLNRDAPLWKNYSEKFIEYMAWMQDITCEKLGPLLWHMHPLVFLNTFKSQINTIAQHFTPQDAKEALRIIFRKYGFEMTKLIEQIFRGETAHFTSGQYVRCGTGGMEVSGKNPKPPSYGWYEPFFLRYPEYSPLGIWWSKENEGGSKHGCNQQETKRKKGYIVFPSVLASMEYKIDYINRYKGNWARWHTLDETTQINYRNLILKIRYPFTKEIQREEMQK